MPKLSWVRFARRVPGLIRQRELAHLEALIDLEHGRQPSRNYFVLSCAIPAGIATFGGGSVFVAWLAGNTGLPLVLGTALTAVLAGAAWWIFFRLYKSVPPSREKLRKAVLKFSSRYASLGNMAGGEHVLTDEFAPILEEAVGLFLKHCPDTGRPIDAAPAKAVRAIEEAMTKLMEVAASQDLQAQNQALVWARPILEELRLLSQSLSEHALAYQNLDLDDPLAGLRNARAELDGRKMAAQELQDHVAS